MKMETAHLYLGVIRCDAMSNEAKRYRQGLKHVYPSLGDLTHDAIGRIKPSGPRSNDRHPQTGSVGTRGERGKSPAEPWRDALLCE